MDGEFQKFLFNNIKLNTQKVKRGANSDMRPSSIEYFLIEFDNNSKCSLTFLFGLLFSFIIEIVAWDICPKASLED